ncbi:MAG TPA: response regulator [Methanobacterium sp.]|nr:response regulator [Methanobacterium sp.]
MSGAKILVVEDERITAEDIKDGLISLGYKVPAVVYSGEDAVKKAEEFRPDLVLMDIMLEGEMDGIEAAKEIKKHYDIPVIYLTAYSDEDTLERAKKTEPSGYVLKEPAGFIHKPFEESELHSVIEITLYRHKMEKSHDQWICALLESINEALIATDNNGKIKFMNNMAEDITGWMQEDALEMDLEEIFRIRSDTSNKFKLDSVVHSEEFTIFTKKEDTVTVKADLNHIKDNEGNINGMALAFRDNY